MEQNARSSRNEVRWYAMRDLKRPNALLPAYMDLRDKGLVLFTPLKWCIKIVRGKKVRVQVPILQDLLFVRECRAVLDEHVRRIPTLQYRFVRGGGYHEPMVVPDEQMEKFIRAVNSTDSPMYFIPEEITPSMCKRKIRIIGGPLNGYEGKLLTIRGSKKKRLLVDIPGVLAAGIEVSPDLIEFI